MRISALLLVITMMAAPAMAGIGSVQLVLTSPDDNSGLDGNPALGIIDYTGGIPAAVPVTVAFTATTQGTSGQNNGVQGIFTDLSGSAMAGVAQVAATPDGTFIAHAFLGGLGFNLLGGAGGTGAVGQIAGIGDAQAVPGSWSSALDAINVGHAGPVPMATANVGVSGAGQINLTGAANLWGFGLPAVQATSPADSVGAASLTIVPEPTTMLLLAPALLVLRRRRSA